MRRLIAAVSVTLSVGSTAAFAQAGDCSPHCDFYHNYGPYDFSYIRPGLTGSPVCDRQGNCSPYLRYYVFGRPVGRITIRTLGKRPTRTSR